MPVRIVEGQLPYTAGDGIEITTDKVIKLLLRDENNLIQINDDNEVYVDLQLADGILPTDEFPVGVTVGRVSSSDGWYQSGTMLNFKTTSGDYGRWIYGTDDHIYYDTGSGIWQQIYTGPEVDALFQQLRSELATVAFTGDYNDLINRPTLPVVGDGILTITQNGTSMGTFSANQQGASTVALTDTTYPSMTAGELGTGTDTTQRTVSAKVIADYVGGKVANAYIYKGSVADYAHLPSSNLTAGDVYNVVAEHTTSPKFVAGSNVAWNGSSRDVLGGEFNIIDNLSSTSTTDALSANQGRILQGQIDDLSALGKFLSLRDATTGLPISFPLSTPYTYSTGDYFVVEVVSTATPPVNYRPNGSSYTGTASSTAETDELEVGDVYIYDGTTWLLQTNHGKTVTFANIAGQPTDNTNLATALGNKQDTLVSGTNIKTINNTSLLGSGDISITSPSTATSSTAGIVKLGDDTTQTVAANAVSSTASRTYAVQLNGSNQMVVNVPRSDTTTSSATSSVSGTIKLASDTTQTEAAQAVSSTAGRTYGIQTNGSGQAVVNVPRSNTTYSQATVNDLGLIKLGSSTAQTEVAETVSSTAGRTYALQVNSSGQGVVNVPRTDNNTTYSAGTGLSLTGTTFANTGVTSFNGSTGAVTYTAPAETVVSGNSGTTYTIKVSNTAPGSGTPATTITFVTA